MVVFIINGSTIIIIKDKTCTFIVLLILVNKYKRLKTNLRDVEMWI